MKLRRTKKLSFFGPPSMHGGLSHEQNVCQFVRPSVCFSNAWIVIKRTKLLHTLCTIWNNYDHPSFSTRKVVGCVWNFGQNWHRFFKNADFQSIFAIAPQPLQIAEKIQWSLIGSTMCCFPMSRRWTAYVTPKHPERGRVQKRKVVVFGQ